MNLSAVDMNASLRPRFRARHDIVSILGRRRYTFLTLFSAVMGVAIIALWALPARYMATSSIIVAEPVATIDASQPAGADKIGDPADLESQILLLKSPRILRVVADVPDIRAAVLQECRQTSGGFLSKLLGASEAQCEARAEQPSRVIDQLQRQLSVGAVGRSRVINVAVESAVPAVAQTLANGLVDAYLADRSRLWTQSRDTSATAMRDDLSRLERELHDDEDKIQAFRSENHLIRGTIAPIGTEQLSALNQSLVQAEAAKSSAYARLQEIEKAGQLDLLDDPTVAESRTIGDLKQRLTVLDLQIARLSSTFGPRHPAMAEFTQMRQALQERVRLELNGIVASTRAAYNSADALVASLRTKLASSETEAQSAVDQETSIGGLVRAVDAKKAKYAELSRQLAQIVTRKPPLADSIRQVSRADLPEVPYFPKRTPFIAGGLVLALMLAGMGSVIADRLDGKVRTAEAIAAQTGLPVIGELPRPGGPTLGRWLRGVIRQRPVGLAKAIEACRADAEFRAALAELAGTLLMNASPQRAVKVALMSPSAGEGRTLTTLALAMTLAEAGRSVAIIEADLRHPSLVGDMGLPDGPGLADILQTSVPIRPIVLVSGRRQLHILPAGQASPDATAAFLGPRMVEIMRWANQFDVVLIDTPPMQASNGALLLARQADQIILCARWGVCETADLAAAADELEQAGIKPLGVVTTMVEIDRQRQFEYRPARATRQRAPLRHTLADVS
ncbi:MAG: hypothetical protein P4L82_10760 [Ancalomicrobiaceae bacterium]|nr:hypothetical protein [Ancalomicrobiaceae bacterium]